MVTVLKNLIGDECHVFVDEVVFSRTAEEHAGMPGHDLEVFDTAHLQIHPYKCAQLQLNDLGYVLSQDGLSASLDKVKAAKDNPVPKNARNVRAFMGLASFYRRLVLYFAKLARPLTTLTRKSQEFILGPNQQGAFEKSKT